MASSKDTGKITHKQIEKYRGQVLDWYDTHGRDLPWRYKNGETANPYHVWLSEIMCQQTTVQAVIPYYTKFLSTWPTIEALAQSKQEDVLSAWAGLGYYARARNLHKCAKIIADDLKGQWPKSATELKQLPGIGDYTSAAIAAIAYNEPATVMDGNIERIMARFFGIKDPLPKAKPIFKKYTARFFDEYEKRTGDFAQALMDIGANICTPKNPKCPSCPLKEGCYAYKNSSQESFPRKDKKKQSPHKFGEVYWITNDKGEVLFHRRPEKGLLAGMAGLPTSTWDVHPPNINKPEALKDVQHIQDIHDTPVTIKHVFTHFDLTLALKKAKLADDTKSPNDYFWANPKKQAQALPTVFRKAERIFSSLR